MPVKSKATFLRYIHSILSYSLMESGENMGDFNQQDFEFLLSMVDSFHFQLGHDVAHSIHHQWTNSLVIILFVGLHITSLVRRWAL